MNKSLVNKFDENNMYVVLSNFYKQIEDSFNIFNQINITNDFAFNKIIICGMGGSAIGGDFIKTILFDKVNKPIYVNRDYSIPKWVDSQTLCIICSYSGNTEESLSCFNKNKKLGSKIIIICSGGKLLKLAMNNNLEYIKIPSGIQPRCAFGYSSSLLILLFNKINLINQKIIDDLYECIGSIKELSKIYSQIDDQNKSIIFASKIYDKFPIIYGTPKTEVVSLRLRCQLAENSKILSSNFSLPEQNHNEIEGFTKSLAKNNIVIWIHDKSDDKRNINRIHATSRLLENNIKNQYFFKENGDSLILRLMKLIYFFDWVSFYGAIYNEINPTPVNKIMHLKKMLSK